MEYNGFINKETWMVNLWINNTQSLYNYWHDVARYEMQHNDFIAATQSLADKIEHFFFKQTDYVTVAGICDYMTDVFRDIICSSLKDVDWDHIAQNLLEGMEVET